MKITMIKIMLGLLMVGCSAYAADVAVLRAVDYVVAPKKGPLAQQDIATLQLQFDHEVELLSQSTERHKLKPGHAVFYLPHASVENNALLKALQKPEIKDIAVSFAKKGDGIVVDIVYDAQTIGMNYSTIDARNSEGQVVRFYFYNKKLVKNMLDIESNKTMLKVASCGFCGAVFV